MKIAIKPVAITPGQTQISLEHENYDYYDICYTYKTNRGFSECIMFLIKRNCYLHISVTSGVAVYKIKEFL